MKPFFMTFQQNMYSIAINMNQVCHIVSDGHTGTIFTFDFAADQQVKESYSEVIERIAQVTR